MTRCVYDNPRKWRRETWSNGELLSACSWRVAGGDCGPWNPGQIVGDASAMPSECYTCGAHEVTGDGRCWDCVQAAQENEP